MTDRPIHILSTISFTETQLARLRDVSPRLRVRQESGSSAADVVAALRAAPETEVLYTGHDIEAWAEAAALQWVQFHFAGVDGVALHRLPERVTVTSASGVHSTVMAEHAFALLLALRRNIPQMLQDQRDHRWPKQRWRIYAQPTLRGQTIGILGYGSIGREVARLAAALGMTVLAYKRDPRQTAEQGFQLAGVGDPDGSIPAAYFGPDALHDLLGRCDVVVSLLPATGATEGLIDAAAFAAMKPTALFLNLGRGATVDQAALAAALRAGTIAGAALDVFDPEPLPADHDLWTLDPRRLLISPHVSAHFPGYDETASRLFAANLERYVAGAPLLNVVDRGAGY